MAAVVMNQKLDLSTDQKLERVQGLARQKIGDDKSKAIGNSESHSETAGDGLISMHFTSFCHIFP